LEKILVNSEHVPESAPLDTETSQSKPCPKLNAGLQDGEGGVEGYVGTDISPSAPTHASCKKIAK
jgi:hypothetical protein